MAMRSGWVRLTVSTMRWVWARPSTGPRWTSLTTAMRKPCAARGSLASGTRTRRTLGPRRTPYVPVATVPTATAAAAPPTARATNRRRVSSSPMTAGSAGSAVAAAPDAGAGSGRLPGERSAAREVR